MHFPITLGLLAVAQLVAGHGAIIKAVGDAGGQGSAIGGMTSTYLPVYIMNIPNIRTVDPATPRDGTKRNPFQQDSTRFKGDNKATCGQTLGVSHYSLNIDMAGPILTASVGWRE